MTGPFDDPAFIAAEAYYLTPPEDQPGSEYEAWEDWNYEIACDRVDALREAWDNENYDRRTDDAA